MLRGRPGLEYYLEGGGLQGGGLSRTEGLEVYLAILSLLVAGLVPPSRVLLGGMHLSIWEIPCLERSDLLSPWAPATKPSITSAGTRGTIVLPEAGSGAIQGSSATASYSPGQSTCDREKGRAN